MDWKGDVLFSHGTYLIAVVAVLFSLYLNTQPTATEILLTQIMQIDTTLGNFTSLFLTYAHQM